MSNFFVLLPGASFRDFAQVDPFWNHPDEYQTAETGRSCPGCGESFGPLSWLPPHRVTIPPTRFDNLLWGVFSFVVTEKLKEALSSSNLSGIEFFHPLEVILNPELKPILYPRLFGVDVVRSLFRVDYENSKVKWETPPKPDYCKGCGPGVGGESGYYSEIKGLALTNPEEINKDFFFLINFPADIFISEKALNFLMAQGLENYSAVPIQDYQHLGHFEKPESQKIISPNFSSLAPKISGIGLYKLDYTKEIFENQLHGSFSESFGEDYAKSQTKEQLERTVIVEIFIEDPSGDFFLGAVSHGNDAFPQIPYLSAFLNSEGNDFLPPKPLKSQNEKSFRVVFFICYWDPANPLILYNDEEVLLPPISSIPERLKYLIKYKAIEC